MAEEPKGWMREQELINLRLKQAIEGLHELKEGVRKLSIVVRDLVYMQITESETEHRAALLEHQAVLEEMCSEREDE